MTYSQRMRVANEKASRNVNMRGNVPKTNVSADFSLRHTTPIVVFVITFVTGMLRSISN